MEIFLFLTRDQARKSNWSQKQKKRKTDNDSLSSSLNISATFISNPTANNYDEEEEDKNLKNSDLTQVEKKSSHFNNIKEDANEEDENPLTSSSKSSRNTNLTPISRRKWTAHSRFKIPLNLIASSTCNIKLQDDKAKLIQKTELILWEEI